MRVREGGNEEGAAPDDVGEHGRRDESLDGLAKRKHIWDTVSHYNKRGKREPNQALLKLKALLPDREWRTAPGTGRAGARSAPTRRSSVCGCG